MRKKTRKAKTNAPKHRAARQAKATIVEAATRDGLYCKMAFEAVRFGETDKVVRHLMAQGMASGAILGKVLAKDLTLLRWVLGKMEDNRREAELEVSLNQSECRAEPQFP